MIIKNITERKDLSHYNGWSWVVDELKKNLITNESGIILDTFTDYKVKLAISNPSGYEALKNKKNSNDLKKLIHYKTTIGNYKTDWVGILHACEDSAPLQKHVTLYNFVNTEWFTLNKDTCAGLVTLSAHAADILKKITDVPIFYTYHPKAVEKQFDINLYFNDPVILQAGFHNRNFSKFAKLATKIPKRINLINESLSSYIPNCYKANNIQEDEANSVQFNLGMLDDNSYINNLIKSVGFCYLYSANANNAVLEHIMSHTPLIVNKLPAVVEYIGEDYPMFYEKIEYDPDKYLLSKSFLSEVSSYLKERSTLDMFKIENFIEFFKNLEIK